jgi:hypothetical protein
LLLAASAALASSARTADAIGALAVDSGERYGFTFNQNSVDAARAAALTQCGAGCQVVVFFNHTCASFAQDKASGSTRYGWAYAPNKEQAQSSAIEACRSTGGTACAVRVWSCEGEIRLDNTVWARDVVAEERQRMQLAVPKPPDVRPAVPPATDNSALARAQTSPPLNVASASPSAAPPPPVPPQAALIAGSVQPPTGVVPLPPPVSAIPTLAADGSRRVALVIGNDAYENLEGLKKAVNDARSISDALGRLGFEVIRVENASRRAMNQKIAEFTGKIGRGDTAFVFYSGHGIEIRGVNYLLAVDTPPAREGQESLISGEGIPADVIIERLQDRGAKITMLVLDACRENPFKSAGTRGVGGTRGLGQMTAPEGVFVLYSAGVGQTALDRLSDNDPNPNSVFTRTLVRLLGQPGQSVQEMAKTTQAEVRRLAGTVNHPQMPAYYDQILGQYTLAPR